MENIKQYEIITDNLLPYPFKYSLPFISRGVTFSNYDKKGGIVANGKCDLTGYPTFICEVDRVMLKANQSYTFSGNCSSEYGFVNIGFKKFNGLKINISYIEIRDGIERKITKNSISTLDNNVISNEVTFIPSEDVYIQFEIVLNSKIGKASNVTFYPMLEESSTKHKYQPYVKSREGIIEQIIADNLIPYPYSESNHIHNGITWTDNGDGTVHARGVAKGNSIFHIVLTYTKGIPLKNGYYTLSGCPLNGSEDTYYMSADYVKNKAYAGIAGKDYGEGATFEITDAQDGIIVMICIKNGTKVEDLTFKPMLEEGVVAHKYQPYALSRAKIVKDISNIEVGGGGDIEVTPLLTEGVKIGEIKTSEKTTELYAPSYEVFGKSGPDASEGLVPAPPKTEGASKYLREDGTWATPEGSGAYPLATQENDGLMSAADKTKLDNIIEEKLVETFTEGDCALESADGNFVDLQFYGNSVQDGSPTPDNPIEIISIGNNGYFDKEFLQGSINNYSGYYAPINYSQLSVTSRNFIPCEEKDNITFSYNHSGSKIRIYLYFYDKNKNFINNIFVDTTIINTIAPTNAKYFKIELSDTNEGILIDEINNGNLSINDKKYIFIIKSFRKNLIKIANFSNVTTYGLTFSNNNDKSVTVTGTATGGSIFYIDSLLLKKGNYLLSGVVNGSKSTYSLGLSSDSRTLVTDGEKLFSITKDEEIVNVVIRFKKNAVINETIYPMLRKVGTDDTYEPYKESINYIPLSTPLKSVGDNKDIISFSENKIIRNIIEKTYNGAENWNYNSEKGYFYLSEENIKPNSKILSSHFPSVTSFTDIDYGVLISTNINIKHKDITNVEDFKTWLETNPVTILYEALEPVIEKFSQVDIKTFNPVTYISTSGNAELKTATYFLNTLDGQGLANSHLGIKEEIEVSKIHPTYEEKSNGLYKITVNSMGHVSEAIDVVKQDIVDLGIPGEEHFNTVHGSPIFVNDSAEGEVIELKAYGQSVQDGNPTPESPIEIHNVGENGWYDGELLLGNYGINANNGYYLGNGTSNYCSRSAIPCKEGDEITLSYGKRMYSFKIVFYDNDMNYISYKSKGTGSVQTFTTTAPENAKFFNFTITPGSNNAIELNKYSPTVTINDKIYMMVIKSSNKNCIKLNRTNFKYNGLTFISDESGVMKISGTAANYGSWRIDKMLLQKGEYTFTGFRKNNIDGQYYLSIDFASSHDIKIIDTDTTFLIDEPEEVTIIFYYSKNDVIDETFNLMLNSSETDNIYEPYRGSIEYIPLSEPLRSIGDIKDEIVCVNGKYKIIRRIKYIQLENVDSKNNIEDANDWLYCKTVGDMLSSANSTDGLSNNFTLKDPANMTLNDADSVGLALSPKYNNGIIYINVGQYLTDNTIEAVNTWLSENPTYIQYPLEEPIIETVDLSDIDTFNNGTYIKSSNNADLQVSYFRYTENGQALADAHVGLKEKFNDITPGGGGESSGDIDISDFVPGDNITIESDNGKIKISSSDTDTTYAAGIGLKLNNNTFAINKIPDKTTTGSIDFSSAENGKLIPTNNTLAYWSGCYNTENTKSNLTHCKQGAFGTATIKDWTNYVSAENENLITSKGVFEALDGLKLGTASTKNYTSYITEGSDNLITSGAVYTGLANKADSEHIRNNYLPLTGGTLSGNLNITKDDETVSQILLQNSLRKGGLSITGAGNLGIYDSTNSKWILSSDASGNNTFNGNATTATTASKLGTDAGSVTQPVYFKNGIPVPTTYSLEASVPSNAKFTDTTYNLVTTSSNGLMSSIDKTKLDNVDTSINNALSEAKTYVDGKFNTIMGEGASSTLDTIGEISKAIEEHRDVTDALNAAIGTKANVSDLNSHINANNIHVTATKKSNWDTAYTKAHTHSNKTILDNTTASYTTTEKTKLSGIATGAEVNQNAFSTINVDGTNISADSKTDTFTIIAGDNVIITPDATNDKVTIAATDTTYFAGNGLLLDNGTFSVNKIPDKTTIGGLGYTSAEAGKLIPTNNTLAFWSGCYNTDNNKSNLTHCKQGEFGVAATKAVTTSVTSGSEDLVTSGGVYTALNGYLSKSTGGTVNGNINIVKDEEAATQILLQNSLRKGTFAVSATGNIGMYDNTNSKWIFSSDTAGKTTFNGNANTSTKLETARTIRTNLGSTSTASFDGSANVSPGVTGTLPVSNGGTGATAAADARTNLGLGSAATKTATSSITSGGTGLITSGAVYTALTTGYKDSGEKTTSMSNNTIYNVADTISLTAGVWMIVGGIVITPGSGATIEKAELSINTGDGVLVKPIKYVKFSENNKTNEKSAFEIVDIVKITSTTSYMLKGRVSYNGSSDASTGVGKITAIRIPGV